MAVKPKKIVPNQYVPSTYDKDKHPIQLIEMFNKGEDICDFCAENDISKPTFFNWLRAHPELDEAYQIARSKAERWLNKKGRESMNSPDFQFNVWSLLMRNRCKTTEHRTVAIDFTGCKSAIAKIKVLEKEILEGNLTTAEAKHMAEFIKCGAEVNEKTEVTKQVEELMRLAGKA